MGFRILNYCLLGLVTVSTLVFPIIAKAQYGFIIHSSNPSANLSSSQIKRILTGDQQYWQNGKRVVIVLPASSSTEKKILLKEVYGMSDQELQTFWMSRVFRGEVASSPMTLASSEAIAEMVGRSEGAIGFVDLGRLSQNKQKESYKVIDGNLFSAQ